MATILAQATGNWSNSGTWAGGVLPGAGGATDDADSNGYTVTIDQDINLNGGALIGTSAGAGGFTVGAARSITANITATVRTVLTASHSSGTVTVNGDLLGGTSALRYAINRTSSGRINVVGNITGRQGTAFFGGFSNGIVNLTGTITGPSASGDNMAVRFYTCTVEVVGSVYGTGVGYGIYTAGATVTITGNCYGSGNSSGVGVETGTLIVNGDCYQAPTSGGSGVCSVGGGVSAITINGNCYGNGFTSQFGGGLYLTSGSHVATINGSAVGGIGGGYGVNNLGTGTVICNAAIAGNACAGLFGQSSSGSTRCRTMQSHANGMIPVYGFVKLIPDQTVNYARFIRSDNNNAIDLSNDYPAVGDVRSGVIYKLGSVTGTMIGGAVSISPAGRM